MSAFNVNLNVIGTTLGVPDEEQIRQGANTVEVTLAVGQNLPFAQSPGGPPVTIPMGTVTYSLDRDAALDFFTKGKEATENLPSHSKLEVASDLNAVEEAAARLQRFTSDPEGR